MFTGIITDIGTVRTIFNKNGTKLTLGVAFDVADVKIGASVACNGICLTVTGRDEKGLSFDASGETLARTTLGTWAEGDEINIERSLKAGDELGGHMVMGHVDAVAKVLKISEIEGGKGITLEMPGAIAHLIAEKGSIAVDGVSLTVNTIGPGRFEVAIIPHTEAVTTFRSLKSGDKVNLEADVFARYSARLKEVRGDSFEQV